MAHSVEQHLTLEARLDKGAKNLLVDCADVRAGQEILIVTEDAAPLYEIRTDIGVQTCPSRTPMFRPRR